MNAMLRAIGAVLILLWLSGGAGFTTSGWIVLLTAAGFALLSAGFLRKRRN